MKDKRVMIFFLGALCFLISQPLIRLPILNYLYQSTRFILIYTLDPLLVGILIALSAGIFEEGFRFIFKVFLLKSWRIGIWEPILFGLGHGIAEAFFILGPYILIVPIGSLALGIVERVLAIILHIGLTVIVWNGFQVNKRIRYLIVAILIHGIVNAMIPVLDSFKNSIVLIEGILILVDILILIYVYRSRSIYYLREGKQ